MKNNKVRMEINRNHHEWFKSQNGKTNNERMSLIRNKLNSRGQSLSSAIYWHNKANKLKNENSALKMVLTMSSVVSAVSVVYLAYAQGWFL